MIWNLQKFIPVILMISSAFGSPPEARSAQTRSLVVGNTAFALDLYGQLKTGSGNLFFSPYRYFRCVPQSLGRGQRIRHRSGRCDGRGYEEKRRYQTASTSTHLPRRPSLHLLRPARSLRQRSVSGPVGGPNTLSPASSSPFQFAHSFHDPQIIRPRFGREIALHRASNGGANRSVGTGDQPAMGLRVAVRV